MILWRVLPWQPQADVDEPGGPLWFARPFQSSGRHDNPQLYGCMYVSESPIAPIAETLAPFRGSGAISDAMLVRSGRRLAVACLTLEETERQRDLIDLDEPRTLARNRLRPSEIATRERAVTQRQAAELFDRHPSAVGIRWWSTLESQMINLTLFDRAAGRISLESARELATEDADVEAAAALLGLDLPPPRAPRGIDA